MSQHGATVLRVCRAMVGSVEAEDAWSETFLAALRAYPDLPADANVEAWLVTIARHKSIDVMRSAARRPVATNEVNEQRGDADAFNGSDYDLLDAVAELPAKQRSAITYHHLQGYSYKEVARMTGSSAVAARRAASDGIKSLRAVYARPSDAQGGP